MQQQTDIEQLSRLKALFQDRTYEQAQALAANQGSYFRSRLFTAHSGINPLLTAAQPLLSLLERLRFNDQYDLKQDLEHELMIFAARCQDFNYNQQTICLARHILHLVVMEFTKNNDSFHSIETKASYSGMTTVSRSSHNVDTAVKPRYDGDDELQYDDGNMKADFFDILVKLRRDPQNQLHLLELMYICLLLGYQGQYRDALQGHEQIALINEELFELVHEQHSEMVQPFSAMPVTTPAVHLRSSKLSTVILSGILAMLVVTLVNLSLDYFVNVSTEPLLQTIATINQQTTLTSTDY